MRITIDGFEAAVLTVGKTRRHVVCSTRPFQVPSPIKNTNLATTIAFKISLKKKIKRLEV